jgi:hypothetical protein
MLDRKNEVDSLLADFTRMKIITILAILGLACFTTDGGEDSGSLLGKPLSALIGSLDSYKIEALPGPKGGPVLTDSDARYALEHSELIDPTLPVVRFNAFPYIANVRLTKKDNPSTTFTIRLRSLGLYEHGPVTYVFKYQLPKDSGKEKK